MSPYNVANTPDGTLVAYSQGPNIAIVAPSDMEPWESEPVDRSVTSVVLSDDGATAVTGGMSGSLTVIDVKEQEIRASDSLPGEIRCLALAGDGRTLVAGCGDGMTGAAVIDIQTMKTLATLEPKNSNVWAVALTRDNKINLNRLVTSSQQISSESCEGLERLEFGPGLGGRRRAPSRRSSSLFQAARYDAAARQASSSFLSR